MLRFACAKQWAASLQPMVAFTSLHLTNSERKLTVSLTIVYTRFCTSEAESNCRRQLQAKRHARLAVGQGVGLRPS
jgi:hypothetical protein